MLPSGAVSFGRYFPALEEAELGGDFLRSDSHADGDFAELAGRVDAWTFSRKLRRYLRVSITKPRLRLFQGIIVGGVQLQHPLYLRAAAATGCRRACSITGGRPGAGRFDENDGMKRYRLRGVLLCDKEVARRWTASEGLSTLSRAFNKGCIPQECGACFGGGNGSCLRKPKTRRRTIARILAGECGAKPTKKECLRWITAVKSAVAVGAAGRGHKAVQRFSLDSCYTARQIRFSNTQGPTVKRSEKETLFVYRHFHAN